MSDFMACRNGFENWKGRREEQAQLLAQLADVVKAHTRKGFATMVLLESWRRINKVYKLKESHCTPYALAGFLTMRDAMAWLSIRERNLRARFIFEDGDLHKGDFLWFMDQLAERRREFAGLKPNFEPKEMTPLQGADFAMWEQVRNVKNQLENPDRDRMPILRDSLKRLMALKSKWTYTDDEGILKFCRDLDVPKRGENRTWSFADALKRQARAEGHQ